MPRPVTTRYRAPEWGRDDCYPDDLLPDLQRTLAALADVEFRSEVAREHLEHEPPGIRELFWLRLRHGIGGSVSPMFSDWSSFGSGSEG